MVNASSAQTPSRVFDVQPRRRDVTQTEHRFDRLRCLCLLVLAGLGAHAAYQGQETGGDRGQDEHGGDNAAHVSWVAIGSLVYYVSRLETAS